jgi:hypothetical protein
MLGAVSARLGQQKVREQFAPAAKELAGLCGFDGAIAAEDLELPSRHRLVERDGEGVWSVCCPALAPSVERLLHLVLNTPSTKEAT